MKYIVEYSRLKDIDLVKITVKKDNKVRTLPPRDTLNVPPRDTLNVPPRDTLNVPPRDTLNVPPRDTLNVPSHDGLSKCTNLIEDIDIKQNCNIDFNEINKTPLNRLDNIFELEGKQILKFEENNDHDYGNVPKSFECKKKIWIVKSASHLISTIYVRLRHYFL